MNQIVLEKLTFDNFKGSDREEIILEPGENFIYGTNGSGKTRLMDGFTWNLTGKDTSGKSDYGIKNTKNPGKNRLDHLVESCLRFNRKKHIFTRIYREVRGRVRGNEVAELKGHTTDYQVNNQDMKAAAYEEFVRSIIGSEDTLKMVTDPLFFNTDRPGKWGWENRRKVLIDIVGEIEPMDILEAAEKIHGPLETLRSLIVKELPLAPQLATLRNRLKKLNERFEELPVAIEEQAATRPQETEADFKEFQDGIDLLTAQDEEIVATISDAAKQEQNALKEYQDRKADVDAVLRKINNEIILKREEYERQKKGKDNEALEVQNKISLAYRAIKTMQTELELVQKQMANKEQRVTALRNRFAEEKAKEFVFGPKKYEDEPCPECGQVVKKGHDLKSVSEKLEKDFNQKKAETLEQIKENATDEKSLIPGFEAQIQQITERINEKNEEIDMLRLEEAKIDKFEMPKTQDIIDEVKATPACIALQEEADALETLVPEKPEIKGQDELREKRRAISVERDALVKKLALRDEIKRVDDRIAALEKEEKESAQEISDVEREIFEIELFSKTNMELVEAQVNNMFEDVSFKLFETQINGGVNQICTMWFEGKTWNSLNTAAQIWAGMQCIKALQKHYDLCAPIWIDNRESTIRIPDMGADCQIINLVVSEAHRKLTVNPK